MKNCNMPDLQTEKYYLREEAPLDAMKIITGLWSIPRLLLFGSILFFMHCEITDPADTFNTWTFSGYVIDGHTGDVLEDVTVYYLKTGTNEQSVTTGSNGSFLIDELPYGERNFRFVYQRKGSSTKYTEKSVLASCWRDASSSTEGVAGDVAQIVRLFPLTGSITGKLVVKIHESGMTVPAESSLVRITFSDTAMEGATPSVYEAVTDGDGVFKVKELPLASGLTFVIPEYTVNQVSYRLSAPPSVVLFPDRVVSIGNLYLTASDTTDWPINSVTSNVISKDGFGKANVPVDVSLYYVLSTAPDPSTVQATIEGGGDPEAIVTVHKDTVFVEPVRNFDYNASVVVTIQGSDRDGNRIYLKFDGIKQFTTEQGVFPVASNTWDATGEPVSNFRLYDTMWAAFSQPLDTSPANIEWYESDADIDIFGSGTNTNATIRIRGDTLFVAPDLRLAVEYGKTVGFKVTVTAQNGKQSDSIDFIAKLTESIYFVKWTNTKDQLGNIRSDFGIEDSVVIVSNVKIREVTAISDVEDATPPADMTLDNIRISGDTIIYKPSLNLALNTTYGMDFNVTFANGVRRDNVLAVTWKTRTGVMILSTNNRQGGSFRALSTYGDSLAMTFSKAINTRSNAPVRFKVNMHDVNGMQIRTEVQWDSTNTRAVIFPKDTLPTADFDASPAYTIDATNTRAVDSVTFDLTTADGEQVFQFGLPGERIELHTEKGICVTNATILSNHDPLLDVNVNETPIDTFDVKGYIDISFSRTVDTARMSAFDLSTFCGIEKKETGLKVPCAITFRSNNCTIRINPASALEVGKEYYVWLKGIPAYGIAGAAAINKHGGTFTGSGANGRLLAKPFKTTSPNIQALTAAVLPDSNTTLSVLNRRLGASAGMTYSAVVGAANTITASSIKFLISESAWNAKHADSVSGYQVQVQNVDRRNGESGWYDVTTTITTTPYPTANQEKLRNRKAEIDLTPASFYTGILTPDGDATGTYFLNSTNLFNDSSSIQIRIRAFVGSGDPLRNEVGVWSSSIAFVDNVAPCDSDFVTSSNCNTLTKGGIQITENIAFNNSAGSATSNTGYIEITFPEDMDPNGPAPSITFFYGPMGDTNPHAALSAVPDNSGKNRWISARKYQLHISVPVFDYTNGYSDQGAFYNVSVAGCRDASGNVIQTYGSNGTLASDDIEGDDRPTRTAAAAELKQGSACVIAGFARCD
ncbi:MAG: hypothetical protein JXA18_13195 [Chitinispirillaceae bacterium]|nr:hypothetical protein [Chitinispirillaceae bacterium]